MYKRQERFDAYGEDAAEKIVEEIKENIAAGGNQELFGDYVGYHNKKASYDDLTEGEQYVIFAFGCDRTGVVTTPLIDVYKRQPLMTQSFIS